MNGMIQDHMDEDVGMDGWMDVFSDILDGCSDVCMYYWTDGCLDGWMLRCTYVLMDGFSDK